MNYGQMFVTLYRRKRSRPSPMEKKCKKAKGLSEEGLKIAVKRREAKSKGEKERYSLGVSTPTPKAQGLISVQE